MFIPNKKGDSWGWNDEIVEQMCHSQTAMGYYFQTGQAVGEMDQCLLH